MTSRLWISPRPQESEALSLIDPGNAFRRLVLGPDTEDGEPPTGIEGAMANRSGLSSHSTA